MMLTVDKTHIASYFAALRLVAAGLADPFAMIGAEKLAAYHDFERYAQSIGLEVFELSTSLYEAQYPLNEIEDVEQAEAEPIVYEDDWMTESSSQLPWNRNQTAETVELMEHAPYCDCLACRPGEPDDTHTVEYFNSVREDDLLVHIEDDLSREQLK